MKSRDWCIKNKLVQPGARGALSKEAKQALADAVANGTVFEDWDANGKITVVAAPKVRVVEIKAPAAPKPVRAKRSVTANPIVTKRTPIRGAKEMHIIDTHGTLIVLDTHSACAEPIQFCKCKELRPPSYIDVDSFTFK